MIGLGIRRAERRRNPRTGSAMFWGYLSEDEVGLTGLGRTALLDAFGAEIAALSLHDAEPDAAGSDELSGGGYARVAPSWASASGNYLQTAGVTSWTIPASTPSHVGFWTSGGGFIGSAPIVNAQARSAGTFDLPRTRFTFAEGDIWMQVGFSDDARVLVHNAGLLQAPLRLDSDCVLVVDPTGFYDPVQRAVINSSLITSRTALAVGLGSAGCAGPIFHTDKYGSAMWLNQTSQVAYVQGTIPTLTSTTHLTIEVTGITMRLATGGAQTLWKCENLDALYVTSAGNIAYYDGAASDISASTVATLLGISDWDEWEARSTPNGTTVDVDVRVPGGSWVSAISGATIAASNFSANWIRSGSNNTVSPFRGRFGGLTVRDGGAGALKAAEFLPSLFSAGNQADGATAVDAYGVTWTVERPAATTDMPRVMVGGTEQYISLPGVSGEYISTPDTAANSITGDLAIKARVAAADGTLVIPAAKYSISGGANRSVYMQFTPGSLLRLVWSEDGTNIKSVYSTASTASGAEYVAAYLDVDNGASGHTVYFYTSTDGITWVQLGSAVTTAGTTSIFDSTAIWEFGTRLNGGTDVSDCVIHWVELISGGLDGTLVERIDATEANPNATTWTSSTSGATVTVNKSASAQYHATVVPAGTTIVQGDGVNDFAQVCGDDTITDFVPATGLTMIADLVVTTGSGSFGRVMSTGPSVQSGILRNSTLERIYGRATDGTNTVQIGGNANNITYNDRTMFVAAFGSSDHESFVGAVSDETAATAVTAFSSTAALTLFRDPAGGGLGAFDLYGAAVVKRRLTDTSPPSEVQTIHTEGISA